jgi:hypothetical protein
MEASGVALAIRRDRTPVSLRIWARRSKDPRAASRAYAIAQALEGLSRAEAARLAGMERQALSEGVVRYNAEGVSGLSDRPRMRASRLTDGQQATLRALILLAPTLSATASRAEPVPILLISSYKGSAIATTSQA